MYSSYDVVTRMDPKQDSDEILSIANDISTNRRNNDLRLVNYYQEMPISYGNIEIDECRGGILKLTVHHNQAVIIAHQKETILKSRHFPGDLSVHAIADHVNIKMSCVSLSKFKYATIKSERREAVRIKLEGNIPVTIKTDSTTFTGTLVDISVNGVRVKDSGLPSNPGHVLITMTFFGEHITVAGKFIREQINDYGHFHSFTIDPNAHAEVTISKMIHARQVELIHMLNEQNLQN